MREDYPEREHALNTPDSKIWRYLDLRKYISLLATRSLYFSRPSAFHDPYEGWLPRSHMERISEIMQKSIAHLNDLPRQEAALHPDVDCSQFQTALEVEKEKYIVCCKQAITDVVEKFGISCWHKNDYESEAMWRAYPAESVAIESTVGRLRDANRHGQSVTIDNVRYSDFDNDPIEKGYTHNLGFLKRKSFEYEQEVRAIVELGEGRGGELRAYNLDVLVAQVHISPRASKAFCQAVTDVTTGVVQPLAKPIIPSRLYEKPDYGIELKP